MPKIIIYNGVTTNTIAEKELGEKPITIGNSVSNCDIKIHRLEGSLEIGINKYGSVYASVLDPKTGFDLRSPQKEIFERGPFYHIIFEKGWQIYLDKESGNLQTSEISEDELAKILEESHIRIIRKE